MRDGVCVGGGGRQLDEEELRKGLGFKRCNGERCGGMVVVQKVVGQCRRGRRIRRGTRGGLVGKG